MCTRISKRSFTCSVFFVVTLVITGFRWDVGIDWMSYYTNFGGEILNKSRLAGSLEPFNLITCTLLQISGFTDGRYWIWMMAFINLFFITKSIYLYSKNILISIALYVLIGFYFDSLNMVRQSCAIAIGLYGWQFIDRSFFKYYFTIGVAFLFHSSALLLLPLFYLYKVSLTKKKLKMLVISAILIAPISTILAPKLIMSIPMYQQYGDSSVLKYASGSGNILSYVRMIFPLFLMFLTISKWNVIRKSNNRTLCMITSCGLLLNIAFPTTQLIIRMAFYFTIGLIFYIPYLFSLFSLKNRKVLWGISISYYSLFLTINYLLSPIAKIVPFSLRFNLSYVKLTILSLLLLCICKGFTYMIKLNLNQRSVEKYNKLYMREN